MQKLRVPYENYVAKIFYMQNFLSGLDKSKEVLGNQNLGSGCPADNQYLLVFFHKKF